MICAPGSSHRKFGTLLGATLLPFATAHSWVEQIQVIGADGQYVGEFGYPRGFVDRSDPDFDGFANKWQIPDPTFHAGHTRMTDSMMACHPSQRISNYSTRHPRLEAAPGDFLALKYLENGHVTRPWDPPGKPQRGGTVWVYGTYRPGKDEKLNDVLQWDANGNAGDGRGWLMAAEDFDDGRCYQLNESPESARRRLEYPNHLPGQPDHPSEQWCETNIQLPHSSREPSILTIYWVWGWDTVPGTENAICGKDEYYTSFLDVEIVNESYRSLNGSALPASHALAQQDLQTRAVSDYNSRNDLNRAPVVFQSEGCRNKTLPVDVDTSTNTELAFGNESLSSSASSRSSPMPTEVIENSVPSVKKAPEGSESPI